MSSETQTQPVEGPRKRGRPRVNRDKKVYFKDWAEKSGLKEKRRQRYATDPEYAQRVRDRSSKAAREKRKTLRESYDGVAIPVRRDRKPIMVELDGVQHEAVAIGRVAKALGRATQTVTVWERRGWIPETFRDETGTRYYLPQQIEALRDALAPTGRMSPEVRAQVVAAWDALGVARVRVQPRA